MLRGETETVMVMCEYNFGRWMATMQVHLRFGEVGTDDLELAIIGIAPESSIICQDITCACLVFQVWKPLSAAAITNDTQIALFYYFS